MKNAILVSIALFVAACAGTPEVNEVDQAIGDYVAVGELESVDSVRIGDRDSHKRITDTYAMYTARDGTFLFEFSSPCRELRDNWQVKADIRRDNRLRAGSDTLRGCRVHRIYALNEAQLAEIRTLAGE